MTGYFGSPALKECLMNKKKTRDRSLAQWLGRLPGIVEIPFQIDRRTLYRVSDLYKGYKPSKPESWIGAFDHRVYEWTLDPKTSKARQLEAYEVVAERLHDVAIGGGIDHFLTSSTQKSAKPAVGFMGGHDTDRNDPAFRQVALIARSLRKAGFVIVSGGGPGLMEAANFGAFMTPYTDTQFEAALGTLSADPKAADHPRWVASACAVRSALLPKWNSKEAPGSESLGIPTWYYGNEPPNLFASHTGKYFFNSVREDGLVSIASGGIVFGPGNAGTVQEVFQDAPLNYYRKTGAQATPMILLGADYWNPRICKDSQVVLPSGKDLHKPVWPLLQTLAAQAKESFQSALKLTDNPDEVVRFISDFHVRTLAGNASWADRSERFKGRALATL
jgi:predicted Rossmann-fold nucleotide-binding protein